MRAVNSPTDGRSPGILRYVLVVACASTAYIGAFTAGALAAPELSGERATSGLPNAIGIASTALAASVLSVVMARRGRRFGLLTGFGIGVLGGLLALVSVLAGSLLLLLVASVALGTSNAAIQLTRYAASDTVSTERRAAVIGTVVWGSTVGAVLGPNLLGPAAGIAGAFGRDRLEGAFVLTLVGMGLALLVALGLPRGRPAPQHDPDAPPALGRRALLAQPRVRAALIGMVSSQVVMVLLMTMTPLHVQEGGHGIGTVGFVISAHTLGMFGLSPVSSRLVTRFGPIPIIVAGFGVLAVAGIVSALAPHDAVPVLAAGLFLLGWGWSLGFIAGSSLLAAGTSTVERISLQGMTDGIVWTAAALASLSAGALLDVVGYSTLGFIAAAILAAPLVAIFIWRPRSAIGTA